MKRPASAIVVMFALLIGIISDPVFAQSDQPVIVEPGRSHEMIEKSARYLVTDSGVELDFESAKAAFSAGEFSRTFQPEKSGEFHDWRVWIALPFERAQTGQSAPIRRVLGIGGVFVKAPRVYLDCKGETAREILASKTGDGGPLSARYFTYLRSQSFDLAPGQSCLALINMASSDNPNLGIFREGELGTRQVAAVLLKGGVTATLLIIGLILAVVSYLTSRPLGLLLGITYSIVMIQNEASLFTTTFIADPLVARDVWENITLLTIFAMLYVFLFGFRSELRLHNGLLRFGSALLLITPIFAIARSSNETPDFIWAFYVALFLFAVTIMLRFDLSRPLRILAGTILFLSAMGGVIVEPYLFGRYLSDLTIEWFRDAFRTFAGLGMLGLLLVDVLKTRRERARMVAERIEALETQARTDRRLLETEREYARARDAAARTKAQLAAASHDIRQPIVGLRAAVSHEAEGLSPALQSRLGQAIDYLEHLTREYADREEPQLPSTDTAQAERYPLSLVIRAVGNMFDSEARKAGIKFTVTQKDYHTRVPALALIRATSNLVANALRHADAKAVDVTVVHDEGRCEIHVIDDGCGMDPAMLAKVQSAGVKSQHSDGDGLGLAIIAELAQRNRFTFKMSSRPGEGTRAVIGLPTE